MELDEDYNVARTSGGHLHYYYYIMFNNFEWGNFTYVCQKLSIESEKSSACNG